MMACRSMRGVLSGIVFTAPAFAAVSITTAQTAIYDFAVNPALSGLDANIEFVIATEGTLIGNYDAKSNPEGTRTKPGLFGAFGPTENVAVPASFGFELAGQPQTASQGSFRLEVHVADSQVTLSNFSLDYLGDSIVALPATLIVGFNTFRTRNPDSVYIGATIPLPFGELLLSSLTAVQVDGPSVGILDLMGDDVYTFTVAPTVVITGAVDAFGNPVEIPPSPALLPLTGTLTLSGSSATISSINPIDIVFADEPMQELPQLPFDLPTFLPPGATAHVLLNLVLTEVSTSIVGEVSLTASGTQVLPGDCDDDLDVDIADFNAWLECFLGPDMATPIGCGCGDVDGDGFSDLRDFGVMQRYYSAP